MAILNTQTTTITAAQYQILANYRANNDRVAFYTALYEMTGNDVAFLMSQISSQSDIAGGVAWLMNEAYAANLSGYPPEGVESFSIRVAGDDFGSIRFDAQTGLYVVPSEAEMLANARDTWDDVGSENGNPTLGDWFPGNSILAAHYLSIGDLTQLQAVLNVETYLSLQFGAFGGLLDGFVEVFADPYNYTQSLDDFIAINDGTSSTYLNPFGEQVTVFKDDEGRTVGVIYDGGVMSVPGQLLNLAGDMLQPLTDWLNAIGLEIGQNAPLPGEIESWLDVALQSATNAIRNRLGDRVGEAEQTVSPLILDLDGNGVETINIAAGVHFDHDANGFAEQTGWAGAQDGLLVWDRNGNGQIDNGRELFGNNTVLANGNVASNGFAALADLDTNQDGQISSSDTLAANLRIWRDADSDGRVDGGELMTLAAAGVQSISTGYLDALQIDVNGNEHRQIGVYTNTSSVQRGIDDVWFTQDRTSTVNLNAVAPDPEIAALPEIAGFGNVASLRQSMQQDASGHLQDLVEAFAAEADGTDRSALVHQIIFAWTGVEAVPIGSRDIFVSDARTVSALEAFMGRQFVQGSGINAGTTSPGPNAAQVLETAYAELAAYVNAQLMAQTHYAELYDGMTVEWRSDGAGFLWNVDGAVQILRDAYQANAAVGIGLLSDFVNGLSHLGTAASIMMSEVRAHGDISGTGFDFALAVVGRDVHAGTSGHDLFVGTLAGDVIIGGGGNDTISGRDGDDIIIGGTGSDHLAGEAGSDVYQFTLGSGQDTINNYDTGVGRRDVLELQGGIDENDVAVSRAGNDLVVQIIGSTDQVTVQGFFIDDAAGGYAIDAIRFGNGAVWNIDAITQRVMQGTSAADTLRAFAVGNTLHGLDGADRLIGHAGNDRLYGDEGSDTLTGAAGDDLLEGGEGADFLSGGDGNDALEGGAGDDTLQGGGGRDTYRYGRDHGFDSITTAGGNDVLELEFGIEPDDVALYRVADALHVVVDGSPNQVVVADHFIDGLSSIRFANGTEWTHQGIAAQALAGTQNTQLGSWHWDEYFLVDHPDDIVEEQASGSYSVLPYSHDVVESWVPYTLPGGIDDLILTGPLNISGVGNNLDNALHGNSGNNVLEGRTGRDMLIGGGGDDTYIFTADDGLDVIDCTSPDGGTDTIRLYGITPGALTFSRAGDSLVISLNANDKIALRNYFGAAAAGLGSLEFAGSGVTWTAAYLWSLVSGLQDPGTAGDDSLQGSVLDDVLDGGAGADVMTGGAGHDLYYVDNAGDVVVEDLGQYSRVDTNAAVYFQDSVISSVSHTLAANVENLELTGSSALSGTGNASANRLIGNAGANVLAGMDGADLLDGREGSDALTGGSGDDTYIVDNAGDTVVEQAAGGWDAVQSSVSFTLSAEVEDLSLTGTAAINATGNNLANMLIGNSAANHLIGGDGNDRLDGGGGSDTLEGGLGDDTYAVQNLDAVLIENSGSGHDRIDAYISYSMAENNNIEELTAAADNITLRGNSADNQLYTQRAGTTLDGGAGDDRLDGYSTTATFLVGRGYGHDLLTRADGTLRFNADTLWSDVTVRTIDADLVIGINGTNDVVTVSGNFGLYGHQSNITRVEFADGTAWDYAQLEAMGNAYVNQAPGVGTRLADQMIAAGTALSMNVPDTMVQDLDTLEQRPVFYATQLDGSALPSWLTFDYATGTFSGTPTTSNLGVLNIAVTGKDAAGTPATDVFSITVYNPALAVTGTSANNSLTGTSGANLIDGLAGADTMTGGAGNDIYIIDQSGDSVVESGGAGTDEIRSSVSIVSLAANVERLTLLGSANLDAVGNTLANVLAGNLGNNSLQGLGGDDTLYGGGAGTDTLSGGMGNDTYIVDSAGVSIVENAAEGIDEVRSYISLTLAANVENLTLVNSFDINVRAGNYNATGNNLANTLTGNEGNNILDGGTGADTLIGGAGDDVYVVDNLADTVTDSAGTDEVRSYISWTLGGGIENLTLLGTANINGTGTSGWDVLVGNSGNNVLTGGSANDTLKGGGGSDTLRGGQGDDAYIVDGTGAVIEEYVGEGLDTVYSSITFTLGTDVEYLTLSGIADINATGNAVGNYIIGNSGNNILDGGGYYDTLKGGAGNDTYVVDEFDTLIENANEGTDDVHSIATWTLGANFENLTLLGATAINGTGNALANVIVGNAANNTLDGGAGADSMQGGFGDDIYTVDNVGDTFVEQAAAGTDTLRTVFTTILSANFENLTLLGSDAVDGTGNSGVNILIGNLASNTLDGGAGADSLQGGAGDDVYIVDNLGDTVVENTSAGLDEVRASVSYTLSSNIERLILTGNALNGTGNGIANYIQGTDAANILEGGAGADTLAGGAGNDVYIVDNIADVVFENSEAGNDEVRAAVTYSLWGNIEELTLTGASAINGSGNSLDNVLRGNTVGNTLNGSTGADTMIGGAGNDIYVVENALDVVVENASEGTDLVQASVSYTLSANVENVTLTGTSAINGIGNSLANTITGNTANNLLDGGAGNDVLIGGAGNDIYMVDSTTDVVTELAGQGTDLIQSLVTYTLSAGVEHLTLTGASAINGTGNSLDNIITGNSASNTLTGGVGVDTLIGGSGNDSYVVENMADVVVENVGDGIDLVQSAATYSLSANVENLTLTGSVAISGTGNELANVLTGNSAANLLDGGAGIDTLVGGGGDDVYVVNESGDVVTENASAGTDLVQSSVTYTLTSDVENLLLTGASTIDGTGNTLANNLTGNSANNILNGGTGADAMLGGAGDDTYVVDNASDTVTENTSQGIDLVQSSVTYTLAANVENLTLTLTAAINGTGNELANILVGNSGNNILNGGAGADVLTGAAGNDTYVVDDTGDVVTENASEGTDLVQSSISYILSADVENLTLTGTGSINGTGNGLVNILTGNTGDNVLDGGAGNDALIGGLGNDTYIVDSSLDGITEGTGAGTDLVLSSAATFTLATNVENLTLTGSGNIDALGNALANILTGNAGNNVLNGLAGADTLIGGAGNDTYVIDNAGDSISENAGEGVDTVQSSVAFTLSSVLENLTLTATGAINGFGNEWDNLLTGNSGVNTLTGYAGNDTLDGGGSADSLIGGIGDDTYIVDNTSDGITELAGQGTDLVLASANYTLSSEVENLTLTGSGAITATGNLLANVLTGNIGANTLSGMAGADTMIGAAGNDTYVVENVADVVVEAADEGTDLVQSSVTYTLSANVEDLTLTGSGAINATGNGLDNVLTGNTGVNNLTGAAGNDTLNGGTGADVLVGGTGNDTYVVDNVADTVTELAGEGTDLVQSSVTFTLSSEVEDLTLTGSGTINAIGNNLANALTGNIGVNTLDGGAGADTLAGGAGNDTYIIDNVGDVVVEGAGAGTDLVQSAVTYTLSANVENLTLTGSSNIGATGNALANILTGNAGANTLTGGAGNDTYVVDNVGDSIVEITAEGTDLVQSSVTFTLSGEVENLTLTGADAINALGNTLDNALTGNAGVNVLTGYGGNDTLNGGTGADSMVGGTGDDTYVVDNVSDTVTELAGEGTDLVQSTVNFTLSNDVENLTLTGSSGLTGTGNALDNILIGNTGANTLVGGAGNDTLNGGTGVDSMTGGLGDDSYVVDSATEGTFENAGEGLDLETSSVTRTLSANIELLFLSGTSALNGTGHALANLLRGNTGINTLMGGGGTDILEGGGGNDILSNTSGNTLFNGGAGTDTLTGAGGNDLLIGGAANDALTTGAGADIIVFNFGDGQDTVAASTTTDNTVSIGGATYADLLFQISGNDLILTVGATDRITFTGYYASTANRSVNTLQVVIEGTSEYASGSSDVLRDNKIETFNFEGLVAAFDTARAANPSLTSWALTNELLAQHLSGSDTAAMGGDLAYRYNRYGTLSDISFTPALGILSAGSFGTSAQTLQAVGSLQDSSTRLN